MTWCVVLFSGSECEDHPGRRCVLNVITEPGWTSAQARAWAEEQLPDELAWMTPHIVPLITGTEMTGP